MQTLPLLLQNEQTRLAKPLLSITAMTFALTTSSQHGLVMCRELSMPGGSVSRQPHGFYLPVLLRLPAVVVINKPHV